MASGALRRNPLRFVGLADRVYEKRDLLNGINLIPAVQSPRKKYSVSRLPQISRISIAVPSHRGAARDRHERGAGCGGRGGRFDECAGLRTAKSCGPDAPTLASSWRSNLPATVAKKPGHRGDHEGNR